MKSVTATFAKRAANEGLEFVIRNQAVFDVAVLMNPSQPLRYVNSLDYIVEAPEGAQLQIYTVACGG